MHHLTTPDGRQLSWSTYGDPSGAPVIAIHGSPDSHVIWSLFHDAAAQHHICLVAPDRPGFGDSAPRPRRTVLDWNDDFELLADHLNLERFGVIAISGGGAYAAATAWAFPDRVTGLGLFSVIGPLDHHGATAGMSRPVRLTYALARRAPWLLGQFVSLLARDATRNPERAAARIKRSRPPEDQVVLSRPPVHSVLLANVPNAFRHPATVVHELQLAVQPWGFPLNEIRVPTSIWQGGRDDIHTTAMARHLADAIPNAHLKIEPTFASFTYLDHLDPILKTFAAWAQRG